MEYWQQIYDHFDPVALELFGFRIHWYGIMYVLALTVALLFAGWLAKKERFLSKKELDVYFLYAEIGIILGARLGYVLFYDPHASYYLTHPWQIFNPFLNGEFVGIRGFSYHGAVVGFLVGTWLFAKRYGKDFWRLLDLVAVAIPLGYFFGRVGNFLNQELVGRPTDLPWAIEVAGVFRHPSQLYEAFCEGIVLFAILYWYRGRKRFDGELIALYAILYGIFRFICEFFREPDIQIGFVCCGWMTMGQLLSLVMIGAGAAVYLWRGRRAQ